MIWLAGSVSRGWADQFSDIEINVIWGKPPSVEERTQVVRDHHGELLSLHPYEEEEWSEAYEIGGVKYEISGFLADTIEGLFECCLQTGEATIDEQCILASIQNGSPLVNEVMYKKWKSQIEPYPFILQKTMIERFGDPGTRWKDRHVMLARQDYFILQDTIQTSLKRLFCVLFALNGRYIPHPVFKWGLREMEESIHIKPEGMKEKLTVLLSHKQSYETKIYTLEELWKEINQLMESLS